MLSAISDTLSCLNMSCTAKFLLFVINVCSLLHSLRNKVRKFQQLCLLLDPMLEASFFMLVVFTVHLKQFQLDQWSQNQVGTLYLWYLRPPGFRPGASGSSQQVDFGKAQKEGSKGQVKNFGTYGTTFGKWCSYSIKIQLNDLLF